MSYKCVAQPEAASKAQIAALLERAKAAERGEPELGIPAEIERREANAAQGRSEGENWRARNPDGTPNRRGLHKRAFGVQKDDAKESLTDPDSRIVKHGNGAFAQSYKGHTAVDADKQISLQAELRKHSADSDPLPGLLDAVQANLDALPQQSLADAGFRGEATLRQLAHVPCDLIVALGRGGARTPASTPGSTSARRPWRPV